MIPLKYNVRNLRVRWKTTLMTMLGTGLVVWSSCILFGLVEGLEHSLRVSGDPLDLIVMRKGSSTETTGGFETSKADDILVLPGIVRDKNGHPIAAKELLEHPDRRARERDEDQHHRSRRSAGIAAASAQFQDRRRPGFADRQRRVHRQPEDVGAVQGRSGWRHPRCSAQRKSTTSSGFSPPAAARPKARCGPISRTSRKIPVATARSLAFSSVRPARRN